MLDHAAVQHRHRAVAATEDAGDVLQLMTAMHGPVVLYLAPDTDGRTPICVRRTDFRPEPGDALAGRTAWHTEFWMADRFREDIDDIDLSIDVRSAPEVDRRSESLETSCGFRFALLIDA
ncbi:MULTISPECIES: DUF779 domain-containing protein [unclassified Nocardia]|uniref:DUF779 domain-containing protein n=1 Tax=Nocardia sp. NPDC056064 TaxID=3345701 RepID=UPI0035DE921B